MEIISHAFSYTNMLSIYVLDNERFRDKNNNYPFAQMSCTFLKLAY